MQWTCTAELPREFKLGSTEVICEGYRDANDPWILKGSCAVEYRMLLTEEGETKYGHLMGSGKIFGGNDGEEYDDRTWKEKLWDLFKGLGTMAIIMVGFIALMTLCTRITGGNTARGDGGWFGGGDGGGGGGWGPPGPPPPYDYQPGRYTKTESWRPGFWSGAAAGAAAGYGLGSRRSAGRRVDTFTPSSSSSSMASPSGATRESTGFGGTRRR